MFKDDKNILLPDLDRVQVGRHRHGFGIAHTLNGHQNQAAWARAQPSPKKLAWDRIFGLTARVVATTSSKEDCVKWTKSVVTALIFRVCGSALLDVLQNFSIRSQASHAWTHIRIWKRWAIQNTICGNRAFDRQTEKHQPQYDELQLKLRHFSRRQVGFCEWLCEQLLALPNPLGSVLEPRSLTHFYQGLVLRRLIAHRIHRPVVVP